MTDMRTSSACFIVCIKELVPRAGDPPGPRDPPEPVAPGPPAVCALDWVLTGLLPCPAGGRMAQGQAPHLVPALSK